MLVLYLVLFLALSASKSSYGFQMRSKHCMSRHSTRSELRMSDQGDLLEQMRRSLGDKEDVYEDAQTESKMLMQGLKDLDRDPNMRANRAFMDWLAEEGVYVQTESTWGRAPHPLVISSTTEDDGETCGRGMLARESLSEGELMMTIPFDLCLTRAGAQEIFGQEVIPDNMDEYIAISLLLMTEKLKGASSRWKPYFDVLPDAAEVYPSYIWADEELELLRGSPVYAASKSLRSKLEREYEEVKARILDKFPTKFPNAEKYTKELFLWTFVMLFSRAARLSSKISGEELALVPYADLMNHNPYSRTYIDAQRSGMPLISRTEEVAVYSDRPYKQFEQVFISYGEKGNADLLLLYGFALERNPFNSVEISVGLSKDDPLYDQKKSYLDRSGRGLASVRFPLQGNRYPSELVDFLRLLLVEPEDLGMQPLQTTDFNEPISPSLERRVLQTLESICESYLEQYATTVEQDEALIMDKGMFATLSRQARMAIKLRASEKKILQATIAASKEELLKLPSVQAGSGDKVVPAGRTFDTMREKADVVEAVNARDMSAWVELKGQKQKKGEEKGDESAAERRRRRRKESRR